MFSFESSQLGCTVAAVLTRPRNMSKMLDKLSRLSGHPTVKKSQVNLTLSAVFTQPLKKNLSKNLVQQHGFDFLEALGKNIPKLWSLTHSRWFCGVPTVGAIGVSVLSGWSLANEGLSLITSVIIPLKVRILRKHLNAVLKAHIVRFT